MADLSREDLIEHLRNRVSLEFADLRGMDLRGLDFSKANLRGADLTECRFAGARLTEARMGRAKLIEADFSGCNLSEADLSLADCTRATFFEANLANTRMVGTILRQADLTQADCTGADLAGGDLCRAKCAATDFRKAILAGADLQGAFLRRALLRGANLTGAKLDGAVGLEDGLAQVRGEAQGEAPSREGGLPVKGYRELRPLAAKAGVEKRPSKYHPPLRRIPAVIFTTGGWIRGVFHVPEMHGFVEHLNLVGDMLKLTHVTLPYLNMELRFFGLKRAKAILILPDCDPTALHLPEPTGEYHVHRVSFLLEGGTVTGSLAIEEDIRVSDYLANHDKFLVLRNCRFGAQNAPKEEESHFPMLLVNCGSVVGASDERFDG